MDPQTIQEFSLKDLPEVVFLRILDFVSTFEYNKLLLVSKKFHETLQLNRYSHLNPVLTIRSCWLHPNRGPWNFLIKSTRKFPSIVVKDERIKGFKESEDFWKKIGQKTTELDLIDCLSSPPNFLTWFPNLISLKVEDIETAHRISLPANVQKLKVPGFSFYDERTLNKEKFKHLHFLGANNFYGIEEVTNRERSSIEFWRVVDSEEFESLRMPTVNLLDMKGLQLSQIHEACPSNNTPFAASIDLYLKLTNLRYLSIHRLDGKGCFFVHKLVPLNFVQNFYLVPAGNPKHNFCQECCKFFAKSCPNVSKLNVSDTRGYRCLELIQILGKTNKLKELTYNSGFFDVNIMEIIFPSLNYLKLEGKVKLEGIEPCTNISSLNFKFSNDSDFEILVKNFPNVTNVQIELKEFDEGHIKILADHWKSVRILEIWTPRGFTELSMKMVLLVHEYFPKLLECNKTCRWMFDDGLIRV